MKEKLHYEFCDISVYDNYIIVVMKEGVILTPSYNNVLAEITKNYFLNKPYVYIIHRKNSYSVDPQIYFETARIENLVGFAVVSTNHQAKTNAKIERMFLNNKPFEIFSYIEEAIVWANNLIEQQEHSFF
ncbi:hypothetical protein [Winogradskyella bathintestinalis]|uniref:STAS/SEC14 domain-containing protein n=1 Tax=Winogradskyella bathintestinalis TaxID=3035208 RepID=A0ABT7ZVE3_9FLAO|nr:hypothetical protein [Winogradskyella bathintestinalis]MDN3492992.1 hypothetical protein [Winogradskyella bathintestinalis]